MKSYKNKGSGIFYKTFIVYICIQQQLQQQNKGANTAGVEVLAWCIFFFFFFLHFQSSVSAK